MRVGRRRRLFGQKERIVERERIGRKREAYGPRREVKKVEKKEEGEARRRCSPVKRRKEYRERKR